MKEVNQVTCEELAQLLPDLIDETLEPRLLEEAEAALARCPECQKELEAARQIKALLVKLQTGSGSAQLRPSANFEAMLYARIRRQKHSLSLIDLSTRSFGLWFIELLNLTGHLFSQGQSVQPKPEPNAP